MRDIFEPSPIAYSQIVLEVTERASVSHLSSLDEHMRGLRAMGYRIAVDDLGAGYAGLTTFARVRPEFVKLDASLVRDIHSASVQQLVVSTVLDLARELGALVVAEAIETELERNALKQLGVDVMQGYYFARPGRPFVGLDPRAFPAGDAPPRALAAAGGLTALPAAP